MKVSDFIEACAGNTPIIIQNIGSKVSYVHTASKWYLAFDGNSQVLGRYKDYVIVNISANGGAISLKIAKDN